MESSRVGEIMMTPVPFRGINLSLLINSIAGIRNAKVFPEPVLADPTKSRPSSSGGIDFAWISVIFVNPMAWIAFIVSSDTFPRNVSKLWSPNNASKAPDAPGSWSRSDFSSSDFISSSCSSESSCGTDFLLFFFLIGASSTSGVSSRTTLRSLFSVIQLKQEKNILQFYMIQD